MDQAQSIQQRFGPAAAAYASALLALGDGAPFFAKEHPRLRALLVFGRGERWMSPDFPNQNGAVLKK